MLMSFCVIFSCYVVLTVGYHRPLCIGFNEEIHCVQSCHAEKTCKNRDIQFNCLQSVEPCKNKCICKEGFLRNDVGLCVTTEQCVKKCPSDEELSKCPISRDIGLYCKEKEHFIRNSLYGGPCYEVCVCKENYLRIDNGTCVPEKQCPIKCGPNQWLDNCPVDCETDYCPTSDKHPEPCIRPDDCSEPTCKCLFGYSRALNGSCIPTRSCPPVDCSDPNQEYDPCPPVCPNDDCSQISPPYKCPTGPAYAVELHTCAPECRCIKGYRKLDGVCVPNEKCPYGCPINEEFAKCIENVHRPMNCLQKQEYGFYADYPAENCRKGCICKEFFLRSKNGTCVPENECESEITCKDNEVLVNCSATCSSDYCPDSADDVQVCSQTESCQQKCKCRFNYREADNGTCIPTRSCPPFDCSDRINEEYNPCPPLCPTDACSLPRVRGICPYKIGTILECNPKCQCKDGYGRVDGICVPFAECPILCPTNEEYSPCIQASCQPQDCAARDKSIPCPAFDEKSCERGCVCKENYYRNEKGDCVSNEECGNCGPNQEIRCVQSCPPEKSCRNCDSKFSCLQWAEPCRYKCVCKEGFLRNAEGDCITKEQCDKCPGANEYFAYGGVCDNVCSNIHVQNKTHCPIQNIVSKKMCYCDDGYARDENGKCIPIEKCKPSCADEYEEYTECKKCCSSDTCLSLDAKLKCDSKEPCKKGCVCKEGYLRKKEGLPCMPKCDCPEMQKSPDCKKKEAKN